ncbi:hypothetical protein K437DRAFT_5216 [Tilletiaria anomala UBC 951]|uniref:Ubiquitin 3 binding protein But2 C-terminal domain-containing protein n=1 Tax=Tilletiaria anomala (strain ATCC 24038 / CBS 436.72 / UBC 951) TaxID=1037660 RepID=A0A066WN64_TILAU|nr:uncharacterized protein K437DRAFT_5216 [Tilletiaria anomala UBC 951]KDN52419.1 hypothetical protein K437DRAFT_5216 [Tilletiaria anomala UBC 951]
MKFFAASVLALAGFAAAVPKTSQPKCKTTKSVATFDDQSYTLALPIVNPVGTYKGLHYEGFSGADTELFGLSIQPVKPPSPPNVIAFGLLNQLTQGTPTVTVVYPGSKSKYLNLHSLYFACFVDTIESIINLPQPACTLKVHGFRDGQEVVTKSFDFKAGSPLLAAKPVKANFEKGTWCNLDTVTFEAESTIPILNAVAIDNIDYTLLDKNCHPKL